MEFWLRDRGFVFPTAIIYNTQRIKLVLYKQILSHFFSYNQFSSVWSLFCNYLEIIPLNTQGKDLKCFV
jgi:hypothetical protein